MSGVKQEIEVLKSVFVNHPIFQVLSASVDEIACRFVSADGKRHQITGNITESYPSTSPLWFADTEDSNVNLALEKLNTLSDNHLLAQVKALVQELYLLQGTPVPKSDLDKLVLNVVESPRPGSSSQSTMEQEEEEEEEEDDDDDDDFDFDMDDVKDVGGGGDKVDPDADILEEHKEMLDTLEKKLGSQAYGSVEASKRLMRELKEIYRSETFKKGDYTVELINESLYQWNIHLRGIDAESDLYKDLMEMKRREGKDYIQFHLTFKENFPFDPPFARIIYPYIERGHVTQAGAICSELLTKQGWSPVYTVEAVIIQIASTLVKGDGRIRFGLDTSTLYSHQRAEQSYENLLNVHSQIGWGNVSKS